MRPRSRFSVVAKHSVFDWTARTGCVLALSYMAHAQDSAKPKPETPPAAPAATVPVASEPPKNETPSLNRDALGRAATLARAGDHSGAAAVVDVVLARLGPKEPFVDELRGTVLTLKKDYTAAEASFRAMLEKAPESHVGRFNLAEVLFLQTRYDEAERTFAAVESVKRDADPALADLCRFKRVVSFLAGGRVDEAEALLPKAEKGPSSPAVQYSRAAIRHIKKLPARAAETLNHARGEFSPDVENLFVDSFIELRWGTRDDSGKFAFVASK